MGESNDGVRVCRICKEEKPLSHFQKCSGYYRTECRECGKVLRKAYYDRTADTRRDYARKWNREHPDRLTEEKFNEVINF